MKPAAFRPGLYRLESVIHLHENDDIRYLILIKAFVLLKPYLHCGILA